MTADTACRETSEQSDQEVNLCFDIEENIADSKRYEEIKRKEEQDEAARVTASISKEIRAVWSFRLLTTAVLVCVAIAVCLFVALNEKANQKTGFETAFQGLGGQLVTTFGSHMLQRIGVVDGFSMELTNECRITPNASWPFFTPHDFEVRASKVAELSQITQLFLLPRVETDQRQDWESYAQEHQGWILQGLVARGHPNTTQIDPFPPYIYTFSNEASSTIVPFTDTPGPYFPVWTHYPAAPRTFTNFNAYANGERGKLQIDAVLETRMASFPQSVEYTHLTAEQRENHASFQRIKLSHPDYDGDPVYTGYYPVYGELDSTALKIEREVVAVVMGGIRWKSYFESILPAQTKPLLVILENQCNQTYTYEVGGSHSRFVDFGDLHNPKYDSLELGTNVNEVVGIDPVTFTLSLGNCNYSIRVYPTEEFEDYYRTSMPMRYAFTLAGVFVFTCLVFLIYDYWVEKRQKVLMKAALQSGTLVSSLFPRDVRDRLYEEEETNQEQRESSSVRVASAIATLYPETTIFFSDLAGFTKWSSSRTPVEVFNLLEKVYGAFDKLAKKYDVFKVETIGDCYVAVTGLPQPQEDHATIMAKFAQSCILQLSTVTNTLVRTLGQDTAELAMRIGLHSGPVTAGVLRGEKSRFQLFGDSVNTASRMESTGVIGRIQCSESTAIALRKGGKGHWLTPREDTVLAKGKGEMQTYWVDLNRGSSENSISGSILTSLTDSEPLEEN